MFQFKIDSLKDLSCREKRELRPFKIQLKLDGNEFNWTRDKGQQSLSKRFQSFFEAWNVSRVT